MGISISTGSIFFPIPASAQEKITLNAVLVEPRERWENVLIPMALQNLTAKHPEIDIQVNYTILLYNAARDQMLKAMENKSIIDLMSVDQIWLGEFADKGYLTDLAITQRPGANLMIGMNQIWMELFITIKYTESGRGLT